MILVVIEVVAADTNFLVNEIKERRKALFFLVKFWDTGTIPSYFQVKENGD